jgi:pimeloyl-ACP methyl ester carboxylesterase
VIWVIVGFKSGSFVVNKNQSVVKRGIVAESRTNKQITLRDDRKLGYAEYGDPHGVPMVYLHGFNASRLEWAFVAAGVRIEALGLRVIAPDRPGMGLSTFQSKRRILDWPDDLATLADALGLDRFRLMGMSGGGPYTAACAYKIPDRLIRVGIVSGMGPAGAPGARDGASMTLPLMNGMVRRVLLTLSARTAASRPEKYLAPMKERMSEPDRAYLNQPGLEKLFMDSTRESFRQGSRGVSYEAGLYMRPWDFEPEDITKEIYLWHGEEDSVVPVSVGNFMAEKIPSCRAQFWPGEGHVSWTGEHLEELLRALVI